MNDNPYEAPQSDPPADCDCVPFGMMMLYAGMIVLLSYVVSNQRARIEQLEAENQYLRNNPVVIHLAP